MRNARSSGAVAGTSMLSAIAASLCCISPVIAILAGTSSVGTNFSWMVPARPYLVGVSIIALAFAWYQQLRTGGTTTDECNCPSTNKRSFLQSKTFLSIVTVFALLMMAFPLYAKVFYPAPKELVKAIVPAKTQQVKFTISGMTCKGCEDHVNHELSTITGVLAYSTSYTNSSSLVTFDRSKVDIDSIAMAINKTGYKVKNYELMNIDNSGVSFYAAPLVCHAAPSIGCGSKAKFLLVHLEKNKSLVAGAWLNRKGTVIAVKWSTNTDASQKNELITTAGSLYGIELTGLSSKEAADHARTFPDKKNWFKGTEVDLLSKEEAIIIARNTIEGYKKDGIVKESFEKQFQADIEKIYVNLFLSISSYQDLTTEAYNKVEEQIQKAGEKYVGKGKMPKVELCVAGESCEKDQSCSKDGKSCCEKN